MNPKDNSPVTSNMIPLRLRILLDSLQHRRVRHPRGPQQCGQILNRKVPVRAPMRLAGARRMLGQDLLAAKRTVTPAAAICIAAHVAVAVAHVVAVLLVEGVVADGTETGAPEDERLFQAQADALEEEGVLQAAKVLELAVAAEGAVDVAHAEREVLGEVVNVARGDLGAVDGRAVAAGVARVGGDEVLGEVVEDGGEAVVLVEVGQGAGSELGGVSWVAKLDRDSHLQRLLQSLRKRIHHHALLLPPGNIRLAAAKIHPP
jgi:hypothetical protein